MNGIDPNNQLADLIRAHVASLRKRQVGMAARSPQALSGAAAASSGDLSSVVAQRIRAIPADDPGRERKAFRLFLETLLLSELGQGLANDPSFTAMVDHVQKQMESDVELARASLEAARVLLKSADGGRPFSAP